MRILILVIFILGASLLAVEPVPANDNRAVQAQLDTLYTQVEGVSESIRNTTHQMYLLCLSVAYSRGIHPCDAVSYCEVSHD